jgi:hypothetical protein
VRHLGLSTSKLAKDLTDAHRLEATMRVSTWSKIERRSRHLPAEDCVELFATSRDFENALSLLAELMCRLEATSGGLRGVQRESMVGIDGIGLPDTW